MTEKSSPTIERPLSPHLQIYRWQMTMALSILHRITGAALAVGTIVLVGWLWAAAYSPEYFQGIHGFFTHIIGKLLLMGWSFAFYFHFCNGIRHLFWDIGKGFDIPNVYRSGWTVITVSSILTILTWISIFSTPGVSE
jgi:succinate dehydrogenase / fumarate reductase cytochrome b subunit